MLLKSQIDFSIYATSSREQPNITLSQNVQNFNPFLPMPMFVLVRFWYPLSLERSNLYIKLARVRSHFDGPVPLKCERNN